MNNVAIFNTCISGSTGKIAVGLFEALEEKGKNVSFYYGREDGPVKENYIRIGNDFNKYMHAGLAKLTGLQGFGSLFPTKRVIKDLIKRKIDTIYIVSPHGYYLNEIELWDYIAENNINVIYLMIDEYAYLGACGYSGDCTRYLEHECKKCPRYNNPIAKIVDGPSKMFRQKAKMYRRCQKLLFIGPEYTIKQAKLSPLMRNSRMEILDEAVNTTFYHPRNTDNLRKKLGIIGDEFVCVCVAPYSYERKGCRYFVELAKRFESNDNYRFIHVGFDVDPKTINLPDNYTPIGFLKDQEELAQYYSLGDLFVFPSLLDTMPNACLEALSSGTPLLLFDISGMPYIADDTVASFVEAKNVDQMENVVRKSHKKTAKEIEICRKYALRRYNNQNYYAKLISFAE